MTEYTGQGRPNPYGKWALTNELAKLAQAQQGARNTTLNTVALKLFQLADAGHLDRDTVRQQLTDTARGIGLDDAEIRKTMHSAEKGAAGKPRSNVPPPDQVGLRRPGPGFGGFLQPGGVGGQPASTELDVQPAAFLPDTFWTARPYLDHIRLAAWSRGRSAEAVLGAVLARVAADTPHRHRLPAVVAHECGLSMLVALVGPPGTGKSSSKKIATELLPRQLLTPECDGIPPGSGEGLVEALFDFVDDDDGHKVKKQVRHNAFVYVDEGEILARQAHRNSSNTILPIMRSMFTGDTTGQANASRDRNRVLPGGSYVFSFVLGIQPDKAADLLGDAGGGTPQRFLWAPTNTRVPAPGDRPEWPGPLERPRLAYHGYDQPGGARLFQLDRAIVDEVQANDHRKQQHGCDPLDELKVAAVLAVLDGRGETVNTTDWQLAEAIMQVSAGTRARVVAEIKKRAAEENRQRGRAEGVRKAVVDDYADDAGLRRAVRKILNKLKREDDWVNRSVLGSACGKDREHLQEALDRLVETGQAEVGGYEYNGRPLARYRLATGGRS